MTAAICCKYCDTCFSFGHADMPYLLCRNRSWQRTKPIQHAEVSSAVLSDNGTD